MIAKLKARNEPRKGRGFGFVSLGSEELQQKAVSEMHGKEVEGREIAVKVAIDSPGKEDIDPEAAGTAPLTENGVVQANDPQPQLHKSFTIEHGQEASRQKSTHACSTREFREDRTQCKFSGGRLQHLFPMQEI